jgi:hypothetical protein
MPAWLLLDAAEGALQRQFRRVERLNRLDVQNRHAGIKARDSGNEKRGERLLPPRPTSYCTFSTTASHGFAAGHESDVELASQLMIRT